VTLTPFWALIRKLFSIYFNIDKLTYFLIVSYFQIGLSLTVWMKKKSFFYLSQDKVPIEYTAQIDRIKNTWNGTATIPMDYLPPHVGRINAYAIHGSGVNRRYESLYPASADVSNPDLWVKSSHCIVNYTIMHWLVKSSLFIFSKQKNLFPCRWGFITFA